MQLINYDSMSESYDSQYVSPECLLENRRIKQILSSNVQIGDRVVDIGCGTGFGRECIRQRVEYTGYDISENMVTAATKKFPMDAFKVGGMKDVTESQIDCVLSLFSIPYIDDGYLPELFAHIKNGGRFIGVYYNKPYNNPNSVYHKKRLYYSLFVKPKVDRFIKKLSEYGDICDRGDLTDNGAYKYIIIRKR